MSYVIHKDGGDPLDPRNLRIVSVLPSAENRTFEQIGIQMLAEQAMFTADCLRQLAKDLESIPGMSGRVATLRLHARDLDRAAGVRG